jgi:catechol-2,3-dioxygenase
MENNKMDFDLYVRTLYKATQYYEKIIELEKLKEIEYLDNGCKNFNILTDFQNEIDELKK